MTSPSSSPKSNKSQWVWSLPIAALILVLWLAGQSFFNKGPVIEIAFCDGRGIVSGQTQLQYRGIPVGKIIEAKLAKDLSKVIVTAQLAREAEGIAAEGSQFWVIRPEVSFDGISGLDTILTGVYIEVEPGNGKSTKRFEGLVEPPVKQGSQNLRIQLLTERVNSTQVGSPVYFRNVSVGQIRSVELSERGTHVILEAGIQARFAHLVRKNSKFWNEGGIDVQGSLLGVKIKAESLETIIKGGVSFATPPPAMGSDDHVTDDTVFILHEQADEDWLEWGGELPLD